MSFTKTSAMRTFIALSLLHLCAVFGYDSTHAESAAALTSVKHNAATVGAFDDSGSAVANPASTTAAGLTASNSDPTVSPKTDAKPLTTDPAAGGLGITGSAIATPLLQDATGKTIVFPIMDSNGRVLYQTAAEMQASALKGNNSTSSMGVKLSSNSTDKGDKDKTAKKGAKGDTNILLAPVFTTLISSFGLGVIFSFLA